MKLVNFKSISEFKSKAEHIKKGSIVPRRIAKFSVRRFQHLLVAGCNQYAIPTPSGYVVFCENNDGYFDSAMKIKATREDIPFAWELKCSPYTPNGCTEWWGNYLLSDDESIIDLNRFLSVMWGC